ncbi:MAG: N-6 DNA methylase [Chthonomonas sp.]|nr:N-6 DNA methylase [Chthonomonas sp.]
MSAESTYYALIEFLGYSSSEQYRSTSDDQLLSGFFRLANEAEIRGAYVLQSDSGPFPFACVVTADSEGDARKKRKQLWCLGLTYLTIVVLPGAIRVYTNSSYKESDPEVGLLLSDTEPVRWPETLRSITAEAIDSGDTWNSRFGRVIANNRVDRHLLANLASLSNYLTKTLDVPTTTAHALIGKYIYTRYLRDRGILTDAWLAQRNIDPTSVFGTTATVQDFRNLVEALDTRFNGQLFPIDFDEEVGLTNTAVSTVAGAISGNQPWSEQLQFEFVSYDFSYIPIETLSIIYEQFLGEQGSQREAGAFYTPTSVASYVLSEVERVRALTPSCKILDPACGSGVFLVLSYRYLIEQMLRSRDTAPTLSELKSILTNQIFGVERNLEACYVAEFSLLLTLLSYVSPRQLEHHDDFKFPNLNGFNIIHSDFFSPNLPFLKSQVKFDWILGNPPWGELERREPDSQLCLDYIATLPKGSVNRFRIHEAFLWRSRSLLENEGVAGLILHATSLSNEQSKSFRQEVFKSCRVRRVTNFSNFTYRLFPTARQPAFVIVFQATEPQSTDQVLHIAPFVAEQPHLRGTSAKAGVPFLTLFEHNFQLVSNKEAISGEARLWKEYLWGTNRDRLALGELRELFSSSIGELARSRGWKIKQGLSLRYRDSDEVIEYMPELEHLRVLDHQSLPNRSNPFEIPESALLSPTPGEQYIRTRSGRGGLAVAYAPHMFISVGEAIYSDCDFVLRHPQIGIACDHSDSAWLKAICMLLWSSVFRYLMFFESSSWGVSTSTIGINSVRSIPIPALTEREVLALASLYEEVRASSDEHLHGRQGRSIPFEMRHKIDETIGVLFGVSEHSLIHAEDFIHFRFQCIQGKSPKYLTRLPRDSDFMEYGKMLSVELSEFTGVVHNVEFEVSNLIVTCKIESGREISSVLVSHSSVTPAAANQMGTAELKRQWRYVRRSLYVVGQDSAQIVKPAHRMLWTRSQALGDSDQLIADFINEARLR